MKDAVFEDELYDSTAESEDDYIPDTNSDVTKVEDKILLSR